MMTSPTQEDHDKMNMLFLEAWLEVTSARVVNDKE
jgi:hypothetical protein